MVSNRTLIWLIIIIKTTISPASVVIMACSSLPERIRSWLSTATMMPMAAILNTKSMFHESKVPFFFPGLFPCARGKPQRLYHSMRSTPLI